MENHNHYAPILEFKDIDFCMSKGRLSKKLTEKMLNNKNSRIKDLEQKLAKAVDAFKYIEKMRGASCLERGCTCLSDTANKILKELGG